jgi:hypothetical protein
MNNLILLLLFIFGGVALMVVLGERFSGPTDPERVAKLQRWILPLLALATVVGAIDYYMN